MADTAQEDEVIKLQDDLDVNDPKFFDAMDDMLSSANPKDEIYGEDNELEDKEEEEEELPEDATGDATADTTADTTGDATEDGTDTTGATADDTATGDPAEPELDADGNPIIAEVVTFNDEELFTLQEGMNVTRGDLNKLFSPIKAGGQEITLNNVDEVLKMVKFGTDYYKKTKELSGDRTLVSSLKKNAITQEDINFFVDLKNKNPDAIKKLLKDSELDIYDDSFDLEAETQYVPTEHGDSAESIALSDELESLKQSEHYDTLMTKVNGMDDGSIGTIYKNPQMLGVLHNQVASGMYDVVAGEVTKQRALRNIPDSTDFLDAYKEVGMKMESAGLLASYGIEIPASNGTTDNNQASTQQANNNTATTQANTAKTIEAKKQFAQNSSNATKAKTGKELTLDDLDDMSDADFKKKFGF